ncbi:MAG: polynucleotide adenylyltransferase PcnB, partial [Victivallales bacterium]|nr:polynucleotide adenylyltransferase PcnB [Victivallales bacterium]
MTTNIRFNSEPTSIVRQLCKAGYEAYIVGGAVRDYLLGKTPKDYDIATNATPEEVRRVFGRRCCQIIGRRFRLALVHYGKNTYEVSTFRREPSAKERKGRKGDDGVMIWNDNVYGTLDDDVRRRDFTVNALYANVLTGEILDKCGGMKDIK